MFAWLNHRNIQPAIRPANQQRRRTDGRRNQRGAVLIEAALVIIPLCLILFGIIEYGFIFKDSLTISSATRSGARAASAEPKQSTFYNDTIKAVDSGSTVASFSSADELWIYRVDQTRIDGVGRPMNNNILSDSDWTCTSQCQVYQYNGVKDLDPASETFDTRWRKTSSPADDWAIADMKVCHGDLDKVGVRLTLHHQSLSGFFQSVLLKEYTVMQLEPQDNVGSSTSC